MNAFGFFFDSHREGIALCGYGFLFLSTFLSFALDFFKFLSVSFHKIKGIVLLSIVKVKASTSKIMTLYDIENIHMKLKN